jgi:hypothetical protein
MDALASALIIARIDVLLFDHKMLSESLLKIEEARKTARRARSKKDKTDSFSTLSSIAR